MNQYVNGEPNYITSHLSELAIAHNDGSISLWDSS